MNEENTMNTEAEDAAEEILEECEEGIPMDARVDIPEEEEPSLEAETEAENAAESEAQVEAENESVSEPETADLAPAPVKSEPGALLRDIEAILFISPDPVSLEVLAEVTGVEGEELAHAVEAVRAGHDGAQGGIVFAEVAGGYTFRTADAAQDAVERFCARPVDYSLSAAAMESLAIIAYLQPIARPEIARIRGVGADTVVANLMDKNLVEEAGRDQKSGAVKYRTTAAFEKLFGMASREDLPSLDGFEATAEDVEELRRKLYTAAEKRQ